MDLFNHLGELALGSRLKRLSDQIMRDGAKIYQANNIEFEPKWFPVFYLLSQDAPKGVTEMAQELGVSHAAVSQVVRELLQKKLISGVRDRQDGRKRLLSLSSYGEKLLPQIRDIWDDIAAAFHQMINDHQSNIIDSIREVEQSFEEMALDQRVAQITQHRCLDKVDIVPYEKELAQKFKDLNYAWINKYFTLEAADRKVLNDPKRYIIDQGGAVLFGVIEQQVAGTCALIKIDHETYELAKMAVAEEFQGRHVGKKLGLAIIEKAKALGAKRLVLESNKKLIPALNLYKKLGFTPVCGDHQKSIYQRANISMQLEFN